MRARRPVHIKFVTIEGNKIASNIFIVFYLLRFIMI
jgi:hypothetical protein